MTYLIDLLKLLATFEKIKLGRGIENMSSTATTEETRGMAD